MHIVGLKDRVYFLVAFVLIVINCINVEAQVKNQMDKSVKRPRLVVGIVVDQMRWDYLYRYTQNIHQVVLSVCLARDLVVIIL